MAGDNSAGIQLSVDNEAGFKRSLKDINALLKVNSSEIYKLTEQYGKNDKSLQGLTEKNRALTKSVESQSEKVKFLSDALSKNAAEYGENDSRTLHYQEQLNKAEAALFKMTNELKENQAALQDAQKDTDSLSSANKVLSQAINDPLDKVKSLTDAIQKSTEKYGENAAGTEKLKTALKSTQIELDKTKSETSSLGDKIRGLADVVGLDIPPALDGMVKKLDGVSSSGATLAGLIGGIVFGLSKLTMGTAENAKEILNLSKTMGMTTDEYQEWDYIMSRVGGSAEEMQGDLSQLAEKAMDAAAGAGEGAELFDKLGVKVTTGGGKLKSQAQIFDETITKLQRMRNETERNAIASALLSTTGEKLVPILDMTKQELEKLKNEAHEMGAVMDEDTTEKFGQLGDAAERWNEALKSTSNSLATAMLPMLTALFDAISKVPPAVMQTILVTTTVIAGIVLLVKSIKEITSTGKSVKAFFTGFDFAANKTKLIILGVVAALAMLAIAIAHITGKGDGLQESLNTVNSTIGGISNPGVSTRGATQRIPAYAKGGVHQGGPAIVNDGPGYPGEIIDLPNGSRIYPHGTTPQGGGDTYNITIEARTIQEFNDIIRITKGQRRRLVQGVN